MTTGEPLRTIQQYRQGNIDLTAVTLRVALFNDTTAFTFDPAAHEFVADVLDGGTTAQEVQDASYSRQGVANPSVTVDATDVETVFDADDVTFSSVSGGETVQGWIVYEQTGGDDTTPGDDAIVACEDDVDNSQGNAVVLQGGDYTLQFAQEGIINVGP